MPVIALIDGITLYTLYNKKFKTGSVRFRTTTYFAMSFMYVVRLEDVSRNEAYNEG